MGVVSVKMSDRSCSPPSVKRVKHSSVGNLGKFNTTRWQVSRSQPLFSLCDDLKFWTRRKIVVWQRETSFEKVEYEDYVRGPKSGLGTGPTWRFRIFKIFHI